MSKQNEAEETAKVTVANGGANLQGVVSAGRVVYVRPGESRVVEMTEAEIERAQRIHTLAVSEGTGESDDPEQAEKQALVAELEALGVKKTTRTSLENLRTALQEAKSKGA